MAWAITGVLMPVSAAPEQGSSAAAHAAAPAESSLSEEEIRTRLARAKALAAPYAEAGMDRDEAFGYAWICVCAECSGMGNAAELMERKVRSGSLASDIAALSRAELAGLLRALEEEEREDFIISGTFLHALLGYLVHWMQTEDPKLYTAGNVGGAPAVSLRWWERAWVYGKQEGELMSSVWWLRHGSDTILNHEPMYTGHPPAGSVLSGHDDRVDLPRKKKKPESTLAITSEEEEEESRRRAAGSSGSSAGGAAAAGGSAGGGGGGGGAVPPIRMSGAAAPGSESGNTPDGGAAPMGEVLWMGNVAALRDGAATTLNKYQASPVLNVNLKDVWRPWSITVDDAGVVMTKRDEANGLIGYAIRGDGYISDYIDAEGAIHATTLTKTGDGILVLANGKNDYSGGTDVQGGVLYVADQGAAGKGEITLHDKTAMWVNYTWNRDYTSSFRNPEVSNDIHLADGASATISYGNFVYRKVNGNDTSRIWRNLYLTGNLSGDANSALYLQGYTSRRVNSTSAAPSFTRTHVGGTVSVPEEIWYSGFILDRPSEADPNKQFFGTVYLQNRTTTSNMAEGNTDDRLSNRWTGAVKVTLHDDLLDHAVLDMTREYAWVTDATLNDAKNGANFTQKLNELLLEGSVNGQVVLNHVAGDAVQQSYADFLAASSSRTANNTALRQTYTNTAIVSSQTSVGELRADLLGVTQDTYADAVEWTEAFEVKHVRVIATERDAHLTLGRDYANNAQNNAANVSWYSGTMGLEGLMYGAKDGVDYFESKSQADVLAVNSSKAGTATSTSGLSLTKEGNNVQNIHTAQLHNLTVLGGTLGFNNVDVEGSLTLASHTRLRLGVNDGMWATAGKTQLEIGEQDGSHAHRFSVVTKDAEVMTSPIVDEEKPVPFAAVVEGQLTLHAGTELEFMIENLGQDTGDRKVIVPVSVTDSHAAALGQLDADQRRYLIDHSLLKVTGTTGVVDAEGQAANVTGLLTLNQKVNVRLTGMNFLREEYDNHTYFLAAADKIIVDGETLGSGHASDFRSRIVTLGYGFYGIVSAIDGHGYYDGEQNYVTYTEQDTKNLKQDFLVLKVAADPTRSWTGSGSAAGATADEPWLSAGNVWAALPDVDSYDDYMASPYAMMNDAQWKENRLYTNGVSVKFGNLYMPDAWAEFLKRGESHAALRAYLAEHPDATLADYVAAHAEDSTAASYLKANPGAGLGDYLSESAGTTLEEFDRVLNSHEVTKVDETQQIFSDIAGQKGHGNGGALRDAQGNILYGADGSSYFNADGSKFETPDHLSAHYEKVVIEGQVRPGYVTVNSDYLLESTDAEGKTVYANRQDDTNYIFTGTGSIADATADDMIGIYEDLLDSDLDAGVTEDLSHWHTGLAKGGTGTLVIDTKNTYSGGSLLRGGLTVMRNKWALGMENPELGFDDPAAKGGRIEMAYGAGLMADYIDSAYNQQHVIAQGQLTNDLTITHMSDFDNRGATGDAQLFNRYDAAVIVNTLTSYDDAILTLRGVSLAEDDPRAVRTDAAGYEHLFYTYADYVITNPVEAYGTIRMAGYLSGEDGRVLTEGGSAYKYGGGNVQLTISGHDASKPVDKVRWDHTTIDLSLNGGNKNVLAIETRFIHEETGAVENTGGKAIKLILGNLKDDGNSGDNACVINDASSERIGSTYSKYDYLAELVLSPSTDQSFSGNLGFGIGQNAEGADMPSRGYISLTKTGIATQRIGKAKLLDLTIGEKNSGGSYSGGTLHIAKALSARSIGTTVYGADRLLIGDVDENAFSHSIVVGRNGILTFENNLLNDSLSLLLPFESASKYGKESTYVLLEDGATVSAAGNWKTEKAIAVQAGADVTFDTHEYRMDPTVSSTMEVYGDVAQDLKDAFGTSHIIWLKEGLVGNNVTVNFTNEQMSAGATEEERGKATANGYVLLRELNNTTRDSDDSTAGSSSTDWRTVQYGLEQNSTVNIGAKTIVQLTGDAVGGNKNRPFKTIAGKDSGITYNISGENAALQFLDEATNFDVLSTIDGHASYVNKAYLTDGGSILFGGAAAIRNEVALVGSNVKGKESLGNTDTLDRDVTKGVDVVITNKTGKQGTVMNVAHTTENTTENGVTYETSLNGNSSSRARLQSVLMTVQEQTTPKVNNTLMSRTDVLDTLIGLEEACSISLRDVLVKESSELRGSGTADGTIGAQAVLLGATAASNQNVACTIPDFDLGSITLTDEASQVNATLTGVSHFALGKGAVQVMRADQLAQTDVGGAGLTLGLKAETLAAAAEAGARYLAIQVTGSGRFLYEQQGSLAAVKLTDFNGVEYSQATGPYWYKVVDSATVASDLGVSKAEVSDTLLYIEVSNKYTPEPTSTALSLLALAALAARRRRK